jgi:lambda repressor-like predicted transcriptional regulator
MRIFRKKESNDNNMINEIVKDLNEKSSTISALSKGIGVSTDITKKSLLVSLKTMPRLIDSALLITLTVLLTKFFM